MVFDITATGFGSGDMFLHWGVGKQLPGQQNKTRVLVAVLPDSLCRSCPNACPNARQERGGVDRSGGDPGTNDSSSQPSTRQDGQTVIHIIYETMILAIIGMAPENSFRDLVGHGVRAAHGRSLADSLSGA